MSLADEVLAEHVKDDPDPNWPAFPDRCKKDWQSWPCESARLATKLRAAEQVVEAAREWKRMHTGLHTQGGETLKKQTRTRTDLIDAVAEYDKGGQG